jgi:hypothetical protein
MNQHTLAILRDHKHKVALRRSIKRIKQQQTSVEEETEIDINNMTT